MGNNGAARATKDELRIGARWPIMVALVLAVLVIMLDNSVLNVALPSIGTSLHAGTAELQWVVMAYSLTFGGLLMTTGNLADRLGRKRVLAVGLAVMAAGSALVLVADSAVELVLVRALVGVGAALAMPSTLSLNYVIFSGPIRTKAIGIWGAASMSGVVLGPLIAGLMLTRLSWHWLFLLNIPVAAVAIPLVLSVVPESKEATGERADVPGALLSVGFLAALIYGISSGPDHGWLSAPVLGALVAAAVLLALFCWRELAAAQPMLDLRMVATRAFAVPAVVEGAAFLVLAAVMFIQTQLVQLVLGYSAFVTGLLTLPVIGAMVVVNGPLAKLSLRVPARYLIAGGLAIVGTGAALVALAPTSVWAIVAGSAVLAVGVRAALTTVAIEVINALPKERAGIGSALNDTFQEIGGVLGVALLGALLNQAYQSAMPAAAPAPVRASVVGALTDPAWAELGRQAFAHGATVALGVGAVLMLLVGVAAALLHRPTPGDGWVTASVTEPDAQPSAG